MQTSYETNLDQFLNAGQLSPNAVGEQITLLADVDTNFGLPVKRDATGEIGELITADTDKIAGIVRHEHNADFKMVAGRALGVRTKGSVVVLTDANAGIKAGVPAYYIIATKLFGIAGDIACGVYQTSVKNDNLASIKIDIVA